MYLPSPKSRLYLRHDHPARRRPRRPKYRPHVPILDRFVAQPTGCWIWDGTRNGNDYGVFDLDGTTWRAHRFFYAYFLGPIPPGIDVIHTCGVRACVNPTHLRPAAKPEKLHQSRPVKLNPVQVQEIRTLHATGTHTLAALARRFGVSRTNIHAIVTGKSWRPIPK